MVTLCSCKVARLVQSRSAECNHVWLVRITELCPSQPLVHDYYFQHVRLSNTKNTTSLTHTSGLRISVKLPITLNAYWKLGRVLIWIFRSLSNLYHIFDELVLMNPCLWLITQNVMGTNWPGLFQKVGGVLFALCITQNQWTEFTENWKRDSSGWQNTIWWSALLLAIGVSLG